jgi:hypothetical protein
MAKRISMRDMLKSDNLKRESSHKWGRRKSGLVAPEHTVQEERKPEPSIARHPGEKMSRRMRRSMLLLRRTRGAGIRIPLMRGHKKRFERMGERKHPHGSSLSRSPVEARAAKRHRQRLAAKRQKQAARRAGRKMR